MRRQESDGDGGAGEKKRPFLTFDFTLTKRS